MPEAKFRMPDGRIARFNVPEGTTPEQASSMAQQFIESQPQQFAAPAPQPAPFTEQLIEKGELSNIFSGLPLESVENIGRKTREQGSLTPLAGGEPDFRNPTGGNVDTIRNLIEIEKLRLVNPAQAENIESIGPVEGAAIGFQTGLREVARGIARPFGGTGVDPTVVEAERQAVELGPGTVAGGQLAGQVAPFLPAGAVAAGGRTIGTRAAALSGLGATEAGTIVAGQEGTPGQVAAAAGVGAVLGPAFELAGPAARALTKKPSGLTPEQQVIQAGEREGVRVLTTDVAPPETALGRLAQAFGEKVPLVGTGAQRAAQQKQREELVTRIADDFDLSIDSPLAESIVNSLSAQNKRVMARAASVRQSAVSKLDEFGEITPSRTVGEIEKQIARQRRLGARADQSLIKKLEDTKSSLEGMDFSLAKDIRSDIIADIQAINRSDDVRSAAIFQSVKSALDKDMIGFARTKDRGAASDWLSSNRQFARQLEKVRRTELKGVLNRADSNPEDVLRVLRSNKPSQLQRLNDSLTEKGRAAARASIIRDSLEGSGFFRGDINPDRFATELGKAKNLNAVNVFFKGKDKTQIEGLRKLLEATRRAQQSAVTTPTGQQLLIPGAFGAAGAATAGSTGAIVGIFAAATTGGIARVYESKAVRSALLKVARANAETPAGSQAINVAFTIINAELAKEQ